MNGGGGAAWRAGAPETGRSGRWRERGGGGGGKVGGGGGKRDETGRATVGRDLMFSVDRVERGDARGARATRAVASTPRAHLRSRPDCGQRARARGRGRAVAGDAGDASPRVVEIEPKLSRRDGLHPGRARAPRTHRRRRRRPSSSRGRERGRARRGRSRAARARAMRRVPRGVLVSHGERRPRLARRLSFVPAIIGHLRSSPRLSQIPPSLAQRPRIRVSRRRRRRGTGRVTARGGG